MMIFSYQALEDIKNGLPLSTACKIYFLPDEKELYLSWLYKHRHNMYIKETSSHEVLQRKSLLF